VVRRSSILKKANDTEYRTPVRRRLRQEKDRPWSGKTGDLNYMSSRRFAYVKLTHYPLSSQLHRWLDVCDVDRFGTHVDTGPACKVPGRRGMSYTEEDWVEEATSHRDPDE